MRGISVWALMQNGMLAQVLWLSHLSCFGLRPTHNSLHFIHWFGIQRPQVWFWGGAELTVCSLEVQGHVLFLCSSSRTKDPELPLPSEQKFLGPHIIHSSIIRHEDTEVGERRIPSLEELTDKEIDVFHAAEAGAGWRYVTSLERRR